MVVVFTVAVAEQCATTCALLSVSIDKIYYCGTCKMKHFNNVNSIKEQEEQQYPFVRLLEFCSWICILVYTKILEPP